MSPHSSHLMPCSRASTPRQASTATTVAAYYSKQPVGLTADFDLIATRELAAGVVLGYARVLFARPDGPVPVFLTVVAERSQDGWALSHYHVSKILEA